MLDTINETLKIEHLRPISFLIMISVMFYLQLKSPAFKNSLKKRKTTNTFLLLYSMLFMRILIPFTIVGVLLLTEKLRPDFLKMDSLTLIIQVPCVIIIFDLLIYWQHRIFHIFNPLWRLHKIHHSDTEMDFTTGFRFHPLEIIISAFYKMIFLFILWPTPEVYIAYEIILSSMAIYNHSNIKHSEKLDKILRKFIVTPNMHFPHHDTTNKLMNKNYGNFLSVWDRLFNSYTEEEVSHFGVNDISPKDSSDMVFLLKSPFLNKYK